MSRNHKLILGYSRKISRCALPSTFQNGHVQRSMLLLILKDFTRVFWEVSGDGHSFVVVGSRFSGSGSVKHKESQKM